MASGVEQPLERNKVAPVPWLRVRAELPPRVRRWVGWGFIALLLLAWAAVTAAKLVLPAFLPSPVSVARAAAEVAGKGDLLPAVLITLKRIWHALLLVVAIGVPLGVLMGSFALFDSLLSPVVAGVKAVPTTAFIALVIVWFGIGERAKVVFLFLGAIFFMLLLVRDAILGVREEHVRTALDLGAGSARTVFSVLLPAAMPQIWDGIIVCNGIMWTYVLLAEFINAQSGLGYLINTASRMQRPDRVFAGIILIAVISVCTDWVLRRVKARWFAY
ncbi:MAG: ABC transporter permease [Armatimonadetes bacterium]|nr:ABC transporter permease [Armatimonadota bacterium]